MSGSTGGPHIAVAGIFAVAGLGFGFAYFSILRLTVDGFTARDGSFLPAAFTLGRIAAAILFFGFAARLGALPLLLAFIGLLMARASLMRIVRRAG